MKYICIRCRHTWSVNNDNHGLIKIFLLYLQEKRNPDPCPYSGGICESCITEYVRGKQKKRGEDPCFKEERTIKVCERNDCTYHEFCCGEPYK